MNNLVFFDDTIDIFSTFIVFVLSGYLINKTANVFKATKTRALGLYIWHSAFSLVYAFFSLIKTADSTYYYIFSKGIMPDFKIGTDAVTYIAGIFTNGFGLSYLGLFMVFNIFGSIGLLAVDASLRHATVDKSGFVKLMAMLIVFLPSMSFWSGAIGKDSIAFMSTGLLLWASIDLKQRYKLFFIAFFFMFIIRPHIAGIMLVAFFLSLLINNNLPLLKKFFYLSILSFVMIIIMPIVFEFIGLNEIISIESLKEYTNLRQSYNLRGGGSIDISSMSFFLKLFTYLFRPLPYEAHSLLSLISSIDNLFLLFIFILSLFSLLKLKKEKFTLNHSKENRWFLLIFSVTAFIMLSSVTANLGISVRQKWMFLPILLYFSFLFLGIKRLNDTKVTKV